MIKRKMNRGKPYSLKQKPPHDSRRIGPPKKKKKKKSNIEGNN
jgi:hypothetical protein